MEPRTLEGTWEEIALHESELVGRRVRVIVLDEPVPQERLDQALAHLITDAEQLAGTLASGETSLPPDAWSEDVLEKFRRQGFVL